MGPYKVSKNIKPTEGLMVDFSGIEPYGGQTADTAPAVENRPQTPAGATRAITPHSLSGCLRQPPEQTRGQQMPTLPCRVCPKPKPIRTTPFPVGWALAAHAFPAPRQPESPPSRLPSPQPPKTTQ